MPCKTCGKDCKCLRMMSKRSCGTRSCDSDCTCPCNTASKVRPTVTGDPSLQCENEQTKCTQSNSTQMVVTNANAETTSAGCGCADS